MEGLDSLKISEEKKKYIVELLNPVLEEMVAEAIHKMPKDPIPFMLEWLENKRVVEEDKDLTVDEKDTLAKENQSLQAEIESMKGHLSEVVNMANNESGTHGDDEEEEDDDDDEPPPDFERPMQTKARQSVSAEAYGAWNQKADFVAPVHDKTPEQRARIAKSLEPSFLFSALDSEEMDTVALAFKERTVEADQLVIEQGDDGECMFLIEEGAVECLIKKDGEERVVKACGAGDVFGELALLYNCPRAASVRSTARTTLWELDRETFNRIVKDAAQKKRDTYTEFLKKVPLFANMDSYEMMTIADALKVEVYEGSGNIIIQQGDQGDKFFIVLEGECEARKAFVAGQEPQKVMAHNVGDYFGELALIKNDSRAASVFTAAPTCKVLSMDRRTFKRLCGPIEDILRREARRYDPPERVT
uniref:Cyclic nucleotide-binding domain-containing protein n=1 Tax=Zooxanthella nutricula TaxID=1333877 RepID=A0A7S2JF33_9DINO